MAGGTSDWETLINHQSSLLTETKNLVGQQAKILEEAKSQSKKNNFTLLIAVLTLATSVVLPLVLNQCN